MTDMVRLTLEDAKALAESVLRDAGLAERHIGPVAATILAGQRDGCASHGLYRLLVCEHTLRIGAVKLDAVPVVGAATSAIVRIDGDGGFAQSALELGTPLLIERAKRYGIATMAITNCVHFSALWPDIEPLAQAGLVALAFTANHAWVAPAGGAEPLFGTNPLAFAWPRPGREPFIIDMATSAIARGDIELHRRAGKPIPLGWGIDGDGRPTEDPEAVMAGAMLPFGGHKGSALALMVELLAGPLIGDMTSLESRAADAGRGASPLGGELIIAIDPVGFLGTDVAPHLARAETVFTAMTAQGARIPSERRYRARTASMAEGIEIPAELHDALRALRA